MKIDRLPRNAILRMRVRIQVGVIQFSGRQVDGVNGCFVAPLGRQSPAPYGRANTKMLLALLGCSSGASVLSPELTSELPVLTATYCLPFTAYVIG